MREANKSAFVRVAGVTKRYGLRAVVDGMSLEAGAGEVLALIGPSGSGKSTMLRLIAGLEAPDEGQIWLGGERVAADGRNFVPPSRRGIGFVFQDLALWPHLTIACNLDFVLAACKVPRRERAERIAETLRLVRIERFAASYPGNLSGGEQQRAALARALVAHPRLLLLDEPMSSLDAHLKSDLLAELSALQRSLGVTTIYVTHAREEAVALAGRVVEMHQGRIGQSEKYPR